MKNFSVFLFLTIGVVCGQDQQDPTLETGALVPMQMMDAHTHSQICTHIQSSRESIQSEQDIDRRKKWLKQIFEHMISGDQIMGILPEIIPSLDDLRVSRVSRLSLHEKYLIVTAYPADMWPQGLERSILVASRVQDDRLLKGIIYQYGFGVTINIPKARKILCSLTGYKKYANYHLALSYEPENTPKYLEYLKIAAEKGHPDAQRIYASLHYRGHLIPQNFDEAVRWFGVAANAGHPAAQYMLGVMYFKGKGVDRNRDKSRAFFTAAAQQGDAEGQLICGQFCYEDRDFHKALEYFQLAVHQQNAEAMYCLGMFYRKGEGIVQNNVKAAEYFGLAAQQGHEPARIQCGKTYALLGHNHLYGQNGANRSDARALEYFHLAAEHGNGGAQKKLGDIYFEGKITSVDHEKAAVYYECAAIQGNADAQNNLGVMYLYGYGVVSDDEIALCWFRASAEQGLKDGVLGLMLMYGSGWGGLDQNKEIANELSALSTDDNRRNLFKYFGRMYELGLGNVSIDKAKAAVFYAKATPSDPSGR